MVKGVKTYSSMRVFSRHSVCHISQFIFSYLFQLLSFSPRSFFASCLFISFSFLYITDKHWALLIPSPWPQKELSVAPKSHAITTSGFTNEDHTLHWNLGGRHHAREGFQACELVSMMWKSYGGVTIPWRSGRQKAGGGRRYYLSPAAADLPAALLGCSLPPVTASNLSAHSDNRLGRNTNIPSSGRCNQQSH